MGINWEEFRTNPNQCTKAGVIIMKVCVIGHFSDTLMEGVRNVSKEIANNLQNAGYTVLRINIKFFLPLAKISEFDPDIIHFIISPSMGGLFIAKITSILLPRSKFVVSSIHSSLKDNYFLKFLKPDLMLVQSKDSEDFFHKYGYNTKFVPNGVNIKKFYPFDQKKKIELRQKMNIPIEEFVILHLASLKKERNLTVFQKIQQRIQYRVIIIGRENEEYDKKVVDDLVASGCTVIIKNFQNIEEIYNIADCYIFPTKDKTACIETPLSVLEAMACNLPIITTNFGTLPRLFVQGEGFFWADTPEQIFRYIDTFKSGDLPINTRQKILDYSWPCIIKRISGYYEKFLY